MLRTRGAQLKRKVKIRWSSNFAYAIGLITSDGNLSNDGRHLGFASAEIELMEKFKIALALTNKITPCRRGGETEKKYFELHFGDKVFYKYLNSIGLTFRKSKTIKSVRVPYKYFADFLRGVFDGDGSFYTFWDTRWPNSFGYKITIASASRIFLEWLKNNLTKFYSVKGHIKKGVGVYEIRYVKGDSRKLFSKMYHRKGLLFLNRKYTKVKSAIAFDETLKSNRGHAAVA